MHLRVNACYVRVIHMFVNEIKPSEHRQKQNVVQMRVKKITRIFRVLYYNKLQYVQLYLYIIIDVMRKRILRTR